MSFEGRFVFPLVEGDHRLAYVPGRSDVLVISFASIGQKRRAMPKDEFVRSVFALGDHHALFVSDKRRSWLNAPELVEDLQRIVQSLRQVDGVTRVVTLGSSMGGYSALAAAHHFDVTASLAFSPQVSVHPDHMPDETRWRHWRRRIKDHLLTKASPLPEDGWFTVFHGLPEDAAHAGAFARQQNVDHFVLADTRSHEVAAHMGAGGGVAALLSAILQGDRRKVAALATDKGATRR
ncbi:MAG: hypothetical protein AAGM21_09910 [Pseudomonadota bacterium]